MEPPSITQFFASELGAPLANPRWSWGSWHEATNRIFLRVWAHDHIQAQDQVRMVRLLREDWTRTSAGYNERARHIEGIRSGAEAFGVIATAAPRGAGHIRIQSYDFRSLVRLGALVHWAKDPTSVFALIGPKVPVTKIGTQTRSVGGEAADIAELIARRDLEKSPTRRRALIDARLGQGKFRRQLLAKWDNACAVTGASVQEALRASHIKPWVRSTDQQRLDPNNGLPLVGTLDALFDRGLISFDNSGRMLISDRVQKNQRQILHLRGQLRLALNEKQVDFLAFHRNECFRG